MNRNDGLIIGLLTAYALVNIIILLSIVIVDWPRAGL